MKIIKDTIDKNSYKIEDVNIYIKNNKLVVCGQPDDNIPDEIGHNCDMMNCSSIEHVLLRADITTIDNDIQYKIKHIDDIPEDEKLDFEINDFIK